MSCVNGSERKHGTVKKFFEAGYGFIFCEEVSTDIFFHLNNWRSSGQPVVGQEVTFELGPAKMAGKPMQAVLIRPVVSAGIAALAKGIAINGEVSPEIGVNGGAA